MAEQRSAEIRAAAEMIFGEMVADLVLTNTINAHREIKRGRMICGVCGTLCRSHAPLQSSSSSTSLKPAPSIGETSSAGPSRASSPLPGSQGNGNGRIAERSGGYEVGPEKGTGGRTGIGSGSGRLDPSTGNVFFDCLVCSRPIVSSKYAPHLASCLGINGSTRRGASRLAATKARLGTNDRGSPSPMLDASSQNGDSDGETTPKKAKKLGLNGNGKRSNSPSKPPLPKKARSMSNVSGTSTPALNGARAALPPSKLGRPPTTSQSLSQMGDSPDTSPEKSVISLPASSTSGTTAGGVVEQRINGSAAAPLIVADGDDSDDGDPDDY